MDLLTYQEAADYLTISVSWLRQISEIEIPRIRMGHRTVRFKQQDLDRYISRKTVNHHDLLRRVFNA